MSHGNCNTCRFFKPGGLEKSGIGLPDGSAEWEYLVGTCTNQKSPHGGWNPSPFGAAGGFQQPHSKPRDNLPAWNSCWLYKNGEHEVK
jgi:hypothetical protein